MVLGSIVSVALVLILAYFAVLCIYEIVRAVYIRMNMTQQERRLQRTPSRMQQRYTIL